MKNSSIYLLVIVTALLAFLPTSRTYGQFGGSSFFDPMWLEGNSPLASATNVRPNTPVYLSVGDNCNATWFNSSGQLIGVGKSIVVTPASVGSYEYSYKCNNETPSGFPSITITVSNSTKSSTPQTWIGTDFDGKPTASSNCSGTVTWVRGNHVINQGNNLSFDQASVDNYIQQTYKVYCTESGKTVSDAGTLKFGQQGQYNLPAPEGKIYITDFVNDFTPGQTTYLYTTGCYGAISWFNNGTQFSTSLSPQVTPQCGDNYTYSCTYQSFVCNLPTDQNCCDPYTSCPDLVKSSGYGGTNGLIGNPIYFFTHPQSRSANAGDNITLSVSATANIGYQWYKDGAIISGATNSTYVINNATATDAGSYTVLVKGSGCTSNVTSNAAIITVSTGPSITLSSTSISCNGGNNGTATVTATQGTPPYTYLWSTGATTATITNLVAGVNYTVTVKDAANKTKSGSITLTEPTALSLVPSKSNVSCFGVLDGTASVTVTGGTSPYSYTWSNGVTSTTNSALGLGPGTYTVTVKDANNCQKSETFTILTPDAITLTPSSTPAKCKGGNDGTATVNANGGTGGYTYTWSGGVTSTTNTATGLVAGSYTVTVKDANNCSKNITITVGEPSTLLTVTIPPPTNLSCNGANDGIATGTVSGGNTPYTYLWSNGNTNLTANNLPAGSSTLQVTDANGCVKTASVSISEPAAIVLVPNSTPVKCKAGNDGVASVTASGGAGGYTYSWSGGITSTTNTATGLVAGTYTVTVKDANNCSKSLAIEVTEPDALTLTPSQSNVSCFGVLDGTASVTVTGGTSPYSYTWSNGVTSTTNAALGLGAGTYTITVKDANNCTKSETFTILSPDAITLTPSSTPAKCKNGNDGTATVSASGGTGGYTYSWSGGITSTTNTATGLTAGTYTVTVKDAKNCEKSITITVGEPSTLLTVTIPTPTNLSCNGANDGIATGNVSGGNTPYTYLWSNGNTNLTANNLPAGSSTLQVTDANGCIKTASVTLSEPAAIVLVPSSTPVKCKAGSDGVATVTASGGAGGYTYSWSGGITSVTNTATGLTAGTYTVTVKDANNCQKSIAITVTEPDALTLVPSSTPVNCNGANDGTASVTVSGGVGSYTYSWSGGITSVTNTATGLTAGTYTVTVKDANNCQKSIAITVTEPAGVTFTTSSTPAKCKNGNDGTATVNASGGTAPYTYSWSGGITSTTNTATGLTAGTYTVTVKDANNCSKSIAITVGEPSTLLTVTIPTPTNISCNGANDGIATATVSGGNTPYTYLWSNGNTNLTANNLPAGSSTLQVTDANGCIKTASVTISEPAAIVLVPSSTPVKCKAGSDGVATVTASGGTGGYTYSWSSGITSVTNTATGLVAGTYTVTVKDANNCSKSIAITVTEPDALTLVPSSTTVKCNGGNDGTASVSVSGGVGSYTYSWSGGIISATNTATGLTAGTYTVTVKDANNCQKSIAITVTEPAAIVLTPSSTPAKCKNGNDGTATVTASGGTAPYTYSWSSGITSTTNTATGLTAGTYTVTVKDANNCSKSIAITVGEPSTLLTVTIPTPTNISCNGANDGIATGTVSGGNTPYTYLWSNGNTNLTANNLPAGNSTLQVTDANGCIKTASVTISEPAAIVLVPSSTPVKCKAGNDGLATVTASGGAGGYTYSWSGGITSVTNTATGLTAGTYTVTVKDANNCTKSIAITVTEPDALTLVPSSTPITCSGGNDGTASVTVSGGVGSYTYSWSGGITSATNTATGLAAGTYTVTVKDANNCSKNVAIVIANPAPIALIPSSVPVKCKGATTGAAGVTASGGTAPYTYSWSGGVTSTTNVATGLAAGTYTVTVKDANNCQNSVAITVSEPSTLLAVTIPSFTNSTCGGANNGTATAQVTGGGVPYTYLWSNGATTLSVTNLGPGTASLQVTDANGCVKTASVTIAEPTPIVLTPSSLAVKCNGGNDGSASVGVTGGVAPYTYAWSGGVTSTTNAATGLTAGNYTVTVKDANNCQKSVVISIAEPSPLVLTPSSTAVVCHGGNSGTASVSVSGGTAPYTYSWSGGITSTSHLLTNLIAGTYTVTVKDANNCTKNVAIVVSEPAPLSLLVSSLSVKCKGGTDGSAVANVSGGKAPYTYSWSGGITSTTNTATGLAAGSYLLTVKDANNCQNSRMVIIDEPAAITLTPSSTAVKCNGGNDGTASVSVSGGIGGYSYSWSGGITSITNTATGLRAGNYTVTVKDGYNCQASTVITVAESPGMILTPSTTWVKCKGGNDGTASVSVSGGKAPYTYAWSGGSTSTTNTVTGLTAGSYTVTVTDASSCQKSVTVIVNEPNELSLSPTSTQVKCQGGNDGTASVNVTGGTAPYTYAWSNGITSTTKTATGLAVGSYTVTVKDANNCQKTLTITVTEPSALTLTTTAVAVKCKAGTDGTATVSASGGTAPYTYAWSNGSTSATATGLVAGTYTVTVKDANGCQKSSSVTISEPEALVLVPSSVAVKCSGDGTAMVTVSGGVSPYTYSWDKGITSTTNVATGLPAGTYTVTVKDANNCQKSVKITIDQPASIVLTSTAVAVKCKGGKDGSASVTVNGGEAPYTYTWSNGRTTNVATGLAAGTYTVLVKDVNGCEKSIDITITEPEALTLAATSVSVKCKGGSDGVASVSVSGGTAPYTYSWSNGITSTTNTATGLAAGTYTVTVTDANNCQQRTQVSVTEPTALSATTSSERVTCKGGNDGTASVSVSGGTAPYSYAWSGGIISTTQTATGLAAGTYSVTIKDANGCQLITTVSVSEPALALTLSSSSTAVQCNGGTDGLASVSVSGGAAPYTYTWSNGSTSTTNIATGLAAGTYTVTVKDANGCQKNTTITVSEPTGMVLTAASEPTKCFGAKDGVASVSVSGGTAPYTYAWSGGVVTTTNTATGLAAGAYTVTVKDANNCQKTLTITVNQPTALVLTSATTAVKCNGGNDGTASVSVSGGTAPYSYVWSNGIVSTTNTATGLAAGTYTVTVKDANNCQQSTTITVIQPAGMVLTPTVVAVKCKGGTDGSASIGVTGGTAPYTYAWSNGIASTTNSATGLAAGTYTVTVKDVNNCQQTVSVTITEPAALVLTPSSTAANCAGSTDGTASVAVSGGTAPYTYAWSGGITSTTNSAKGLAAGTYTVTVKDANNCQQTASITITEPDAATRMVLTPEVTPAKCFGGTGSATVAVTGGISPYTYLWSNGATTPELTNATAGEYTVTVKDAKGCSTAKAVTITSPTEIIIKSTIVNVKCNPQATGRILVEVSGGTAPYAYQWSTGSKNFLITDLKAGIYSVTITDKLNCSKTMEFEVTQPAEPLQQAYITVGPVSCKGKADGYASTMAVGGTAPYTYLWSTNSTNPDVENLSGGNYTFKITDANNCVLDSQITVFEPKAVSLTAKITPPLCKGLNGTIVVTADDGDTNGVQYGYSWNGGPFTPNNSIIGPAGSYSVEVKYYYKECPGKVETFVIEDAYQELSLTLDVVPEKCFGEKNGKALVTPIGGVAPYQYLWNTGETSYQVSNFSDGDISVTVTDKNGCVSKASKSVDGLRPLEVSFEVTDILCFGGATGKIMPIIRGGNGFYEAYIYSVERYKDPFNDYINYRLLNRDTFTGLKAQTYQIEVFDKNGCQATPQFVTVKQPETPVSIALGEAVSPRGFGIADGKLSFAVKGGTVPFGNYTTSWKVDGTDFNNTTSAVQGSQFFTQSSTAVGGNYLITATDENGCKAEFNYLLKQPDKLVADFYNIANPSCAGKVDGQIWATVSGGVPVNLSVPLNERYKLKWFRKTTSGLLDLNQSSESISNIEAGIYVIKITDKNEVSAEFEMELKPTPSIMVLASTTAPPCQSTKTGSIQLSNFSGGTAPYTVTWNRGLKGTTITNLEAGLYYAVIKDSKGCFGEVAIRLSPVTDYRIDLYTKKEPTCKGECTGELGVYFRKNNGNGGFIVPSSAPWRDASGKVISSKRSDVGSLASNLCAGVYTITATAGACEVTKSFEIKAPERSFAIEVSNDLQLCKSATEVLIDAKQPEAASYQWTLPNGTVLTTPVASIENSGQYKVEVTDTFGCKASDVFNVTILDKETTANFALQNGGAVGLPVVAVPLLIEQKNYKWRVPDGITIVGNNANGLTFIAQRPGVFVIQMIVEEEGCEATISKTITITQPRSGRIATSESAVNVPKVDEEATFIVYPNPSNGRFVIQPLNHAPTDSLEFNVFDAGTGRLLYSNKGANNGQNSVEVSIEEQPQGMVTVVMQKNGKKVTKKVIIQK